MQVPLLIELHQPHRILGAIGPVLAQPHDRIQDPIALIEHMAHFQTGVIGIATDPPQPSCGQLIKPGKAETSRDQTAAVCWPAAPQGAGAPAACNWLWPPATVPRAPIVAVAGQTRR